MHIIGNTTRGSAKGGASSGASRPLEAEPLVALLIICCLLPQKRNDSLEAEAEAEAEPLASRFVPVETDNSHPKFDVVL